LFCFIFKKEKEKVFLTVVDCFCAKRKKKKNLCFVLFSFYNKEKKMGSKTRKREQE